MPETTFLGVSPRSLGDLLKGYGLIATIGEQVPETRFWWDEGFHLVADMPDGPMLWEQILQNLPEWAEQIATAFQRTRQKSCDKPLPCPDHPNVKKKGKKKTCPAVLVASTDSALKTGAGHDRFDPFIAEFGRAAAIARSGDDLNAEPHPWFPGYGQDGSANYFDQLEEAAGDAKKSPGDLEWSLFGVGRERIKAVLDKGYLFFPEPTKRYATGVAKWEQERAAVTTWCFLLALRGAFLLRGSLRRPRWRRSGYPAFPFAFEGGGIAEVHLPTWTRDHPRTLGELRLQVHQFHAPLSHHTYAATAGEFRAAVQRRGPAVGFDCFQRFVMELRRPGQQQRMPQAIPRGMTRVYRDKDAIDLRGMIAPLGESGWIDQFMVRGDERVYALEKRRRLDDAIHRAVDEPTLGSFLGILESAAELNRELVLPGKMRRIFEKQGRTPRPAPPLPVDLWERALNDGWHRSVEWRLARALASIVGCRPDSGRQVGPILEQMLPVQYQSESKSWTAAESRAEYSGWLGRSPLHDFQTLLWRRWLVSDGLPQVPLAGVRTAPLSDVLEVLRGEIAIAEIHKLTFLFAHFGWQDAHRVEFEPEETRPLPMPPAYTALRLWLDLGISPARDSRPPRDGEVARSLSLGGGRQVEAAVSRALSRLRIQGLPRFSPPPIGKAVANVQPRLTAKEAERMALAVLIPISDKNTFLLSRRLLVATIEKEISA
jgi:CRISPR-associated protein Csx17